MCPIKYHSVLCVLGGEAPDTSSSTVCNNNNNNTNNNSFNKFTVDTIPLSSIEVCDPLLGLNSKWNIVDQVTWIWI